MTQRLTQVEPAQATGKVKELYDAVNAQIKMIPNLFRVFANSPQVLEGYLSLSGALSKDSLPAKLREQLAITTAEANGCDYCVSAHTTLGKMAGLDASELEKAQSGKSADSKTEAALTFARKIVETRGHVADADVAAVKAAGYNDAQIVEIISHVSLNIFTNITNNVARTKIDFPVVSFINKKAAA